MPHDPVAQDGEGGSGDPLQHPSPEKRQPAGRCVHWGHSASLGTGLLDKTMAFIAFFTHHLFYFRGRLNQTTQYDSQVPRKQDESLDSPILQPDEPGYHSGPKKGSSEFGN